MFSFRSIDLESPLSYASRSLSVPRQLLDYGFKPDYWSNTHHFFAFFFYGYATGEDPAYLMGRIYEQNTTNIEEDIRVGDRAARIGSWFANSGPIQLPSVSVAYPLAALQNGSRELFLAPTLDLLAPVLGTELCLEPKQKAWLRLYLTTASKGSN